MILTILKQNQHVRTFPRGPIFSTTVSNCNDTVHFVFDSNGGYRFTKISGKFNHFMYMVDFIKKNLYQEKGIGGLNTNGEDLLSEYQDGIWN